MTPRLRWFAAGALLPILLLGLLALSQCARARRAESSLGEAERRAAEALLVAGGFHRADPGPPVIDDIRPDGLRGSPGMTLRGRVAPVPPPPTLSTPPGQSPRTVPPADVEGPPAEPTEAAVLPLPCLIQPEDLSGGCSAEVIYLAGKPWARLYWDGAVRLPSGREVKRGPILADEMEFRMEPSPAAPPRTLLGASLLLSGGRDGPGALLLVELSPRSSAVSGRWLEGRVKLVGGIEELPGERRYLAGIGFTGGLGRR